MADDGTALDWFMADARRQGLTIAEYERQYGILLSELAGRSAATQRIARHEVSSGSMTIEDLDLAQVKAKRPAGIAPARTRKPPGP